MTKIITIANQKGGVGKTTTAVTLSAALGELGKHILLVDIDPQGNATTGFGVDKNEQENTVYEVIIGDCAVNEAIIKDVVPFVDLMPSNVNLSGAEIELTQFDNREYRLKEQLDYLAFSLQYGIFTILGIDIFLVFQEKISCLIECSLHSFSRC
jgi:chromosome partitioning protein